MNKAIDEDRTAGSTALGGERDGAQGTMSDATTAGAAERERADHERADHERADRERADHERKDSERNDRERDDSVAAVSPHPSVTGIALALPVLVIVTLLALLAYHYLSGVPGSSKGTAPPSAPGPGLVPCPPPELSDDREAKELETALRRSLRYFKNRKPGETLRFGNDTITVARMIDSLEDLVSALKSKGLGKDFFEHLRDDYRFYRADSQSVLFTGYYIPALHGSWKKTDRYRFPLYRVPDDLCTVRLDRFPRLKDVKGLPKVLRGRLTGKNEVVPYYTREEIDYGGRLEGRKLEILWVDSEVDRFFLQVQGSGVVLFEDGSSRRVNYAGCSGRGYRSIGRFLIDEGILTRDNVSMPAIRKYLEEHPSEVRRVLCHDPSYVFFRLADDGPFGCIGVKLTPWRSVATDRSVFPQGAPCLVRTEKPIFDPGRTAVTGWRPFTRLMVNQDTGGAIRGPGRVDLFCGHGREAELTAGHQKQQGMIWFFVKKGPGDR